MSPIQVSVNVLGGTQLAVLDVVDSWTGVDIKVALKGYLQPHIWIRKLVWDDRVIADSDTIGALGLTSGDVLTASLAEDLSILLPDGSEIKMHGEGISSVGDLKQKLRENDLVLPKLKVRKMGDGRWVDDHVRDNKSHRLMCEEGELDDGKPIADLPQCSLTLEVLSANYNMSNFYCSSLSAKRTAVPESLGGFRQGSWPRFNNHCLECRRPVDWVSGDVSGGGRSRHGVFFCQHCMLSIYAHEEND